MLNFSKISTSVIKSGSRLLKVLRFGSTDTRECQESMPFGVDSVPLKDMTAIYADSELKGRPFVIGYINTNQLAEAGEMRIYSLQSSGELSTYIRLKNTPGEGQILLGGTDDYAVRFSQLKTAFDELQNKFNDLVLKFNAHVHSGVTTGPGTSGISSVLGSQSTADIDNAKNNKIKTVV